MRFVSPCVVLLVGPSGAGKTTWAEQVFGAGAVLSSDRLRAMVGEGENDLSASADAFALLDLAASKRIARRLTTVVDTLGTDADRRAALLDAARRHDLPCYAVRFDVTPGLCRSRNVSRAKRVPDDVLRRQFEAYRSVRDCLEAEGYTDVYTVTEDERPPAAKVGRAFADAQVHAARQAEHRVGLGFGLQIPNFTWPGGPGEMAGRLASIAQRAEAAGFESLWVMDHFRQIPQVGAEWLDILESYTTLGYLAAHTSTVRLATMVTGITYRNIGHLAKIVATLDVLSGGRAVCGVGAAWFEKEHRAYGWDFPPVSERFAILEDALQALPLLWGKGSPSFTGRRISIPEAMSYPRPLQARIPILVGGMGEKQTLRLAATYADACNLMGDPSIVRHKLAVLHRHARDVGRDGSEIQVTHLSTALAAADDDGLRAAVKRLRPARMSTERYAARFNAGTVADHIGRFRSLADAGVQVAVVSLPEVGDPNLNAIEDFAPIIEAFS